MINRYVAVGRLTKDPELRRTGTGKAVTTFTLAINRTYQSNDGQQADYISCVTWNKVAENVAQYCSKGSLVCIEGRLRSRSYDNSQGQRVYVTEVICDSVQFLDTRNRDNQQNTQQNTQPPIQQDDFMGNSYNIEEDDLAF